MPAINQMITWRCLLFLLGAYSRVQAFPLEPELWNAGEPIKVTVAYDGALIGC
jgi:hypothetical protein